MTKKPKAKAADEGSPLPVEAPKKGKKPKVGVTAEVQAVVHSPAEGPSANCAVRVHGVHTLNARDNNAVQMRNKRAMTVLHLRLPAKRSRVTTY